MWALVRLHFTNKLCPVCIGREVIPEKVLVELVGSEILVISLTHGKAFNLTGAPAQPTARPISPRPYVPFHNLSHRAVDRP